MATSRARVVAREEGRAGIAVGTGRRNNRRSRMAIGEVIAKTRVVRNGREKSSKHSSLGLGKRVKVAE